MFSTSGPKFVFLRSNLTLEFHERFLYMRRAFVQGRDDDPSATLLMFALAWHASGVETTVDIIAAATTTTTTSLFLYETMALRTKKRARIALECEIPVIFSWQ